jgi:hypothetical protein
MKLNAAARKRCQMKVTTEMPEQICLMISRRARKNCRMKAFSPILLAGTLAIPSFTQDAKTNAVPEQISTTNKVMQSALTFPASAGVVSTPLVLTNGTISQPETTDVADGGKAIYNFTTTNAGNYVIQAVVNAPGEDSNSFYVNVDTQPEDPVMIWDIEPTNGFEERTVSWRGNGDASSDEFAPKRFNLSAGAHKLIIVGREATAQLKSISIHPAAD